MKSPYRFKRIYLFALLLICSGLPGITVTAQNTDHATLQNPVISANFPDPFILKVEGTYYAFSTNSNSRNVPVYTSTDLVHWEPGRDALPSLPRWVDLSNANVWAPEVLQIDNQFLLFYTARDKNSDRQCIGLAISDQPQGPYRDHRDAPFICQSEEGGSIDPDPFRDQDGTLYLFWKNDGNCCMMPTYIYGQQLAADGLSLVGEPARLLRNSLPWHGPVIEAPTMWLQEGRYYLFYSANVYAGEKYAVGYATCDGPLGPCQDADENPILSSVMEGSPLMVGPGHQTVIRDEAGATWIVYHVWQITPGGIRTDNRQMWMDRLEWVEGRPVVRGPTRDPQSGPVTASPVSATDEPTETEEP